MFWPRVLVRPPDDLIRVDVPAAKLISLLATGALIFLIFTSDSAILGRNLLQLDRGGSVCLNGLEPFSK
ncbi:hypothetical protein, partial [Aliiruegeria sabulilitoris]|uniref:hypothetical protein n=1 Tax=Aliiruegeria sabulilitoris TaxID=1510458 RepID=UPI001E37AFA8